MNLWQRWRHRRLLRQGFAVEEVLHRRTYDDNLVVTEVIYRHRSGKEKRVVIRGWVDVFL
jgi:hypothetical protein